MSQIVVYVCVCNNHDNVHACDCCRLVNLCVRTRSYLYVLKYANVFVTLLMVKSEYIYLHDYRCTTTSDRVFRSFYF